MRSRAAHSSIAILCLSAAGVLGASGQGCSPPAQSAAAARAPAPIEAEAAPASLPPAGRGGFTDVTRAAGIHIRHTLPGDDLDNIVDAVGAGAAFIDTDGDGWLDLVVAGGPRSPAQTGGSRHAGLVLYRNDGRGRFVEATADSGLPRDATAVAVTVGDADGDGSPDLYLVDRGPNRLFLNDGQGRFHETTAPAGVGHPGFGVGAAFFDMDSDGDQDLYVTNYLQYDPRQTAHFSPDAFPGPLAYNAEHDVLYRNNGRGRFEDVSSEAGIDGQAGRGMSLAASDFDDDGDTDMFVANDATANFLWLNDGQGHFREEGMLSGVAMSENGEQAATMSSSVGDVSGDGLADLLVSDTAYGAFYRRIGPARFIDDVMSSGLARLSGQYVSWGQTLLDYNHDGLLDLFVVNGGLHHLVGWEDLLLRNTGGGVFADGSMDAGAYFSRQRAGRCVVRGDYDNDGDLDLFVTVSGGRPSLLRNDHVDPGNWIVLDLRRRDGRSPLGARVTLRSGGRTQVGEWRNPTTYLGSSDPRLHFGLGSAATVESLTIIWPDGRHQTEGPFPAGQIRRILENS